MARQTLVIMVKDPKPGQVKSRLARDIGRLPAAWWQRRNLRALVLRLASPKWECVLAVAPDLAVASPLLPPLPRIGQGSGNLGDRMTRVFQRAPKGRVIIVGADVPGIESQHISAGFASLGSHMAVIGPAMDGGYWSVGLDTRRPIPRDLFSGVRWSSSHALEDTLQTLPNPAFLPVLSDVDTANDLARLSR